MSLLSWLMVSTSCARLRANSSSSIVRRVVATSCSESGVACDDSLSCGVKPLIAFVWAPAQS